MDNPQYYQPLSHALHAPVVSQPHPSPRQQYSSYGSHHQTTTTNGAGSGHREEEEEEEEDDEEVVEEELDHHDADHARQSASSHSSPRVNAAQTQPSSTGAPAPSAPADYNRQPTAQHDSAPTVASDEGTEKRRPGRPRGSKNRKPRVSTGSASKAPANVAHPGFYSYPPAPPANVSQNQQFYEFQWRALNLCSEFYNAAEELVKAASPMVIAQCYQSGPANKIDPLLMIADAKRVCDSLLANPSQLVGQPVPTTSYPSYASMPPPPAPGASGSGAAAPAPGAVITNPQTFVMPLNASSMPPPSQAYYAPVYSAPPPGSRYPTAPYYYPPPQGAAPYYPPPPPASSASAPPAQSSPPAQAAPPAAPPTATPSASSPIPAQAPAPAPSVPSNTGTISTFSAATGNTAPGGHQGTWSEEETERLKRLAEQSKEMGGPQNKGEIEWDWVVQQWGVSRTRHQILLKATSLGLKESTTRGTKRRREAEPAQDNSAPPPPPQHAQQQSQAQAHHHQQPQHAAQQQQQQQQQQHQHQHQQHQHQQPQSHQHQQHPQQHPPPHQAQHHPQHHQQSPHQANAASIISPARSPVTSTPASMNASPAMQPQRPPSSSTIGANAMASGRTTSSTSATVNASTSLPWPMPTVAVNTPSPVMASASTDSRNNSYYRPRPTQTTSYSAAASAASTNSQRPPSSHGPPSAPHQYMYPTNGARRDSRA